MGTRCLKVAAVGFVIAAVKKPSTTESFEGSCLGGFLLACTQA
jgi:hypothetical protein